MEHIRGDDGPKLDLQQHPHSGHQKPPSTFFPREFAFQNTEDQIPRSLHLFYKEKAGNRLMSWKSILEFHQQRRKMSKAITAAWSHAEQTLHFRNCLFHKANIISQFQRQMKSPYNRSRRSSAVQFVSQYTWPQNIFSMTCAFQHSKATNRSQVHLCSHYQHFQQCSVCFSSTFNTSASVFFP